jgi:hypothetical protein
LSRQPSLRSHALDDGAISNQTIVYPGDPRVIVPIRSSSLRRTTSMTDLGEEFESALRRAKDARPGLCFGLSLVGEGLQSLSQADRRSDAMLSLHHLPVLVLAVLVHDPPQRHRHQRRMIRSLPLEPEPLANPQRYTYPRLRRTQSDRQKC